MGRDAELGRLATWVADLASGRGRVVLVEGEPGIGKSALLHATADAAAESGCAVYRGSGEELEQAFPLRPLLAAFGVGEPTAGPGQQAVWTALHAPHDGAAAAAAEALLELVDQQCAETPVLLLVDDLHWADKTTVAICHRLGRTAAQRPLLLVAAMRPLPRRSDLKSLRSALGRDHVLTLDPLSPQAVGVLVANLTHGQPGPSLLQRAADAAGNPLYITELVAALDRGHLLARASGAIEVTGPAPATLTEAITDRLRFLPESTRHVLQDAALLGVEFGGDDLAAVSGHRPAHLAQPLAEARMAGVLVDAGHRMAFRHPLIRAALYDDLPATVRAARHRANARALHEAGASPEHIASQLLPAVSEGDDAAGWSGLDDWGVSWLLEAAGELTGQASGVAVALLRAAVPQLPVADTRRHALASHLARALYYRNENAAVETLVGETLPHVTDPDALVTLFDALVRTRIVTGERQPETLTAIDQALTARPGLTDTTRNRLRAIAARVHGERRELDRTERVAQLALDTALKSGDRWTVASSANSLGAILSDRGNLREAIDRFDQGLAATDGQPALIDARLLLLCNRGETLMRLDRLDEARTTLTMAWTAAERTGKVQRLANARACLCELSYETGRWDDALVEADLPDDVEDTLSLNPARAVTALILMHRKQASAARKPLAIARLIATRLGTFPNLSVRAEALDREIGGDPAAALAVYRTAVEGEARPAEREPWLAEIVRLAIVSGDRVTATDAADRAADLLAAERTDRRAAAAAHCRGLIDADPQLLLEAADSYAAAGRPLPRAEALETAATLLTERGDAAGAREPAIAAMDGYAALGATWDLARARAVFRRHGLRQPTRRLKRPTSGWDALTPTEAKVAELVAEGLSNPEIAKKLVVARTTIEYHVARILAKLEVRSRIEVLRLAADRHKQAAD